MDPTDPAGEARAFADWAGPSLLAMTRLAQRMCPPGEAEDVVQEALVQAWRKWHLFDPTRGSATTWLLAITANRARAAHRDRARVLRVVDATAPLPDPSPASERADPDGDLDLERAVAGLAERQRLAVHLHYFLDLSVQDTAAVLGCAPGTVKSTLHDARRRLRAELGADDD